jgi:hypothetical protein
MESLSEQATPGSPPRMPTAWSDAKFLELENSTKDCPLVLLLGQIGIDMDKDFSTAERAEDRSILRRCAL